MIYIRIWMVYNLVVNVTLWNSQSQFTISIQNFNRLPIVGIQVSMENLADISEHQSSSLF